MDRDLELAEFLNEFYSLKHHKSPGYDGITNDDFASLIPKESPTDESTAPAKLACLNFIFKIIENFWFNESVPRDFKRTILRPCLKNEDKDQTIPVNYNRPISLLNSLMKIYEGMICRRISTYLEDHNIISPFKAAYRNNRSIFDHIRI